ncbi:DNA cytosine methyltransferase [Chryseobacterium sp.]|uniref:DNA cytosine methyltransferase n=1 Tax=Chryseobacterium sp. TaxID=1871047 RepID=UPI002FC973A5
MLEVKDKKLESYRFIDLFAGLGGFRLALESYGAECVYSSEWDKDAQNVYEKNFGDRPDGDITKVDEDNIPQHDIICAGFPCQAFSISGKQRGFEDSRGTLFFDVARIAKRHKPKVIFLENVKNFASHDNGNTLKVIKSTLEELGYDVNYKVLNSVDYGMPQKRERIYIVCFRKDLNIKDFKYPEPIKLTRHVEDFLEKDSLITPFDERKYKIVFNGKEDIEHSNKMIRLGIVNKGGQGERVYSAKGIAATLSAYGGGVFAKTGGYLIDGKARKLSPRECARLMGYPDSYKMADNNNQAYKQFGNSVVVDVLQYIVREIIKVL